MSRLQRICDRKFGFEVIAALKATRMIPKRTSFRSSWQNGIAERWVGSCRRDLMDQIVVLNERHLKRLLSEYARYHHEDRTHLGLEKGTPEGRIRSVASGRVLAQERLGGLHYQQWCFFGSRLKHRGDVTDNRRVSTLTIYVAHLDLISVPVLFGSSPHPRNPYRTKNLTLLARYQSLRPGFGTLPAFLHPRRQF